jgi:hypothetical protein
MAYRVWMAGHFEMASSIYWNLKGLSERVGAAGGLSGS